MTSITRKACILGLGLLAVLAVVGVGYAAIQGANGVINACYSSDGSVRVIDTEASPPQTCSKGWKPLSQDGH